MSHQDDLIEQYESWIYPKPIDDLDAYSAAGGRDLSDPERLKYKLWPHQDAPKNLRILVAGCGANQAAIIAHANPQHLVTGIDLSEQAIANHLRLQERHQLANLNLHSLAVEDAASLGLFDYIVTTGVLHHLKDPSLGLNALRQALSPKGVMSVMLYSRNRRAGVYMVQDALRVLGAGRDLSGVAMTRDVLQNLPDWHHARQYVVGAPDLGYDAGLVDTFLNARDRAFDVPELLRLVEDTGLAFQGWLDGFYYSPSAAFPATATIQQRIHDLPKSDQWHVVDLLAQPTATHRFLICHPGRESAGVSPFEGDDWQTAVLHRHPDLQIHTQPGRPATLSREGHEFSLAPQAVDAILRLDGELTIDAVLAGLPDTSFETVAAVLAMLVEWDHLRFTC